MLKLHFSFLFKCVIFSAIFWLILLKKLTTWWLVFTNACLFQAAYSNKLYSISEWPLLILPVTNSTVILPNRCWCVVNAKIKLNFFFLSVSLELVLYELTNLLNLDLYTKFWFWNVSICLPLRHRTFCLFFRSSQWRGGAKNGASAQHRPIPDKKFSNFFIFSFTL